MLCVLAAKLVAFGQTSIHMKKGNLRMSKLPSKNLHTQSCITSVSENCHGAQQVQDHAPLGKQLYLICSTYYFEI